MSRRVKLFGPLRQDKNGTTYHIEVLRREAMSRNDPERARDINLKWDFDRTMAAITNGQRFPMKREKAERLARRLMA